jgi:hypothetical protein
VPIIASTYFDFGKPPLGGGQTTQPITTNPVDVNPQPE